MSDERRAHRRFHVYRDHIYVGHEVAASARDAVLAVADMTGVGSGRRGSDGCMRTLWWASGLTAWGILIYPSAPDRPLAQLPMTSLAARIMGAVQGALNPDRPTDEPHGQTRIKVTIEIARDELDGGYVSRVLEFPGCVSQGDTEQEALDNAVDALAAVIEARMTSHIDAHDYEELPAPARIAWPSRGGPRTAAAGRSCRSR